MKKLLPKRKPERKPSDEEFALRKSEYAPRVAEDMGPSRAQHSRHGGQGWGALVAFQRLQLLGSEP